MDYNTIMERMAAIGYEYPGHYAPVIMRSNDEITQRMRERAARGFKPHPKPLCGYSTKRKEELRAIAIEKEITLRELVLIEDFDYACDYS
jgi:hypothetical protein